MDSGLGFPRGLRVPDEGGDGGVEAGHQLRLGHAQPPQVGEVRRARALLSVLAPRAAHLQPQRSRPPREVRPGEPRQRDVDRGPQCGAQVAEGD